MQITVVNKHHGTPGEYVGRGSPLGNPYASRPGTKALQQVETREEAIALYDRWLNQRINDGDSAVCDELNRLYAIASKGPLNLVCFCAPKSCHGDVIKRVLSEAHASQITL